MKGAGSAGLKSERIDGNAMDSKEGTDVTVLLVDVSDLHGCGGCCSWFRFGYDRV